MTTSPLAYVWGDDDFAMGRHIDRLAAALAEEGGSALERWDLRGQRNGVEALLGQLQERTATPVMFGGGTLAVVSNVGALMQSNDGRDAVLGAIATLAPGNALVFLDVTKSGMRGPSKVVVSKAVAEAGGVVREMSSPKGDGLAGWIAREAQDRGVALAPDAAKELAARLGGFVQQNDVERPFLTRTASSELDKLALYRGSATVTVEDVQALVAEAMPGTVWGFVDAVGERKVAAAASLLDDLIETTPEPVLLVMLHRRVRQLIEIIDRVAARESLPAIAKALGMKSDYQVRTYAAQARNWTVDELADALHGLLELDAMVKHAPGWDADEYQRRLAFTLWVMDHVSRRERRSA
jgi:DNA polymerase III delta subunit